jgi:hypothetical protein
MGLPKCIQEEKFLSRPGIELNLTAAEYVQSNLMDKLLKTVQWKEQKTKQEEREQKTCFSVTVCIALESMSIYTMHVLWVVYCLQP